MKTSFQRQPSPRFVPIKGQPTKSVARLHLEYETFALADVRVLYELAHRLKGTMNSFSLESIIEVLQRNKKRINADMLRGDWNTITSAHLKSV